MQKTMWTKLGAQSKNDSIALYKGAQYNLRVGGVLFKDPRDLIYKALNYRRNASMPVRQESHESNSSSGHGSLIEPNTTTHLHTYKEKQRLLHRD